MDIIVEARKYKKNKKKLNCDANVKIAVVGSTSIQYFVMILDYLLYKSGIQSEIYEGEYNGITMDVFEEKSELYKFKPDIVIVLTHYMDIKIFPELLESDINISKKIDDVMAYYQMVWDKLGTIKNVSVLQSNFVVPPEHIFGNMETALPYSKSNFYRKINERFVSDAPDMVSIIDLDLLSQYIGKYQWCDYRAYFMSKFCAKLDFFPDIANLFKNQIVSVKGKYRKCLVLDLDNTLWGGVVGDEGYDGIQLDPNNAIGEAYRYFQSYVLELKNRGVILAVCSKNDELNAKEPFEKNPNMLIKLDDISCFIANWDDKVTNLKKIAKILNIGTDSLVFVDDNPAERTIVKEYLPEVYVVDLPTDPALYALQLDKENPFNWIQFTEEDITRSKSYIENRNREVLVSRFTNYEEYLMALEMYGKVGEISEKEVTRFTQLLNKSNQFNLRTQRYTEAEIISLLKEQNTKCIYVNLKDKFSEYGIIACVILKKRENTCFIESWVMSCRVLKRGVENLTFNYICDIAKEWGCSELYGEYIKSKKNFMVSTFYDSLGFECINQDDLIKQYLFILSNDYKTKHYIKVTM